MGYINKAVSFLFILVLVLHYAAVQPAYAALGYYYSGYENGVLPPVYFGPILFTSDTLRYEDGKTWFSFTVTNTEKQPFQGEFNISLCDTDHNVIAQVSEFLDLGAGENTRRGCELDGDVSSAVEWHITQSSSILTRNEAEQITAPYTIEDMLLLDHIQLYKTVYNYWIFKCDVEKLTGEGRELPEKLGMQFICRDSRGQEVLDQEIAFRIKDSSTHMAFYTMADLSGADSFEAKCLLSSEPQEPPLVTAIRNSNNLGVSGRFLGTAYLGKFYFHDIMITDGATLTGTVVNQESRTKKGLFRFCFFKDKAFLTSILVYAGDGIEPWQSKKFSTHSTEPLSEADTVYVMDAEAFGAERGTDLLMEGIQPFPDEFHLSQSWTYFPWTDFPVKFRLHSLKYQNGNTEFSYSLEDSDSQNAYEGSIKISFYRGDRYIATMTDDITIADCSHCQEFPNSSYHHYDRTIRTEEDLSDANRLRICFEEAGVTVDAACNDYAEVISPKQFDSGIRIDDIHLYDQFDNDTCFRFRIQNNGKWFEKKNLLFALIDENGEVYLDSSLSAYFFYQGREEWREMYFYERLKIRKLIVVVSDPCDYDMFEKYAQTAPTPSPKPTPTPSPIPTPTPTIRRKSTPAPSSQPTPSPQPAAVPTKKPAVTLPSPGGSDSAPKKAKKLMRPKIRVTTKKYIKNIRIAKIRLIKYQGTNIEIFYCRRKGKFKRVKLRQSNIKKNKKIFSIGYKKGKKTMYLRVRTYKKKNGKKIFSIYSKKWRVR